MREFVAGSPFKYDRALAALAVVLEARYTSFADEYLLDLARLYNKAELEFSPRVAQLCRSAWSANRPRITVKYKTIAPAAVHIRPAAFSNFYLVSPNLVKKHQRGSHVFKSRMSDATT